MYVEASCAYNYAFFETDTNHQRMQNHSIMLEHQFTPGMILRIHVIQAMLALVCKLMI